MPSIGWPSPPENNITVVSSPGGASRLRGKITQPARTHAAAAYMDGRCGLITLVQRTTRQTRAQKPAGPGADPRHRVRPHGCADASPIGWLARPAVGSTASRVRRLLDILTEPSRGWRIAGI